MTPLDSPVIRQRRLRLRQDLPPEVVAGLPVAISTLPEVVSATLVEGCLRVGYRFPQTGFRAILGCLDGRAQVPLFSAGYRLLYGGLAWLEDNEGSHMVRPLLMQSWVETVYLHFFDRRHAGSQDHRRHSWQKIRRRPID